MTIEIKAPELQTLIQTRLRNGQYQGLDELLLKALQSLPDEEPPPSAKQPKKSLAQFLLDSPLPGSGLEL